MVLAARRLPPAARKTVAVAAMKEERVTVTTMTTMRMTHIAEDGIIMTMKAIADVTNK